MSRTRRRDHYARDPDHPSVHDGRQGIYASPPTSHDHTLYVVRRDRREITALLHHQASDPEDEIAWPMRSTHAARWWRMW